MNLNYSVYLHIPFCRHRCAYCDFNTYAGQEGAIPAYVDALCHEIRQVGNQARSMQVGTIFFGGGTPSLLSVGQFEEIFSNLNNYFDVLPDAEISLEANPGTVSMDYLAGLHSIGFNRISYGVQSANPQELRMLERIHTYSDVVDAFRWSRQAGFDNLNFDLIFGLPEQSLETWQQTMRLVAGLHPEHISAYALTLEHGTPFGKWAEKGILPLPDPDLAASQYEWTMQFFASEGYEQYEISNWSLPGRRCQHNLQYWENLNYLGLGAGAHGFINGIRYSNVLRINTYIDRVTANNKDGYIFPLSNATVNHHKNTPRENMQETMLTGLRLTSAGVSDNIFFERYGNRIMEIFGKEINQLISWDLLEWVGDRIRLTVRGRLLGNQVFIRFVGD
jgi:oxygen-independent coproporphyrinogen-3 oxidase